MSFDPPYDTRGLAANPLAFTCPHCGTQAAYGTVLAELKVLRCNHCSGGFDPEGRALSIDRRRALAAMDMVVHGREAERGWLGRILAGGSETEVFIEGVSTASERAHWLRFAFGQFQLPVDTDLFAATRKQLARCYGQVEPEVSAPPRGYRGEQPDTARRTYSGEVPSTSRFTSNTLEVREDVIACGRARVPRDRAAYFRIHRMMHEQAIVSFVLDCVSTKQRATRLTTIAPGQLERLQEVVVEMEAALGWLHVRRT